MAKKVKNLNTGKVYKTAAKAAEDMGARQCANAIRKSARGYTFAFGCKWVYC